MRNLRAQGSLCKFTISQSHFVGANRIQGFLTFVEVNLELANALRLELKIIPYPLVKFPGFC